MGRGSGVLRRHSGTEGLQDDLDDALSVAEDIAVPEAQHTEALSFEPAGPCLIAGEPQRVLSTVDLDDEALGKADKIGDERSYGDLTAKPKTSELLPAQRSPQPPFRLRRMAAQISCSLRNHLLMIVEGGARSSMQQPPP
jgi:hypothetical protein